MILLISSMCPFQNLFLSKHSKAFKYGNFIFTDLFHGYKYMAGVL